MNNLGETLKRMTQDLTEEKHAVSTTHEKLAVAHSEIVAIEAAQLQYHQAPADIQKIVEEPVEQRVRKAKRKNVAVISKKPKVHL